MPAPTRHPLRQAVRDGAGAWLWRAGLTRPARAAAGRLTVVTLHRVLPEAARAAYPLPQLAVTVEELEWLLGWLSRHYTCAPLTEAWSRLAAGERPARPLLAITLDDGQRDNYDHARPALERAGLRATFFVAVEAVERGGALWHDRLAFAAARLWGADPAAAARLLGEGAAPGGAAAPLAAAARAVARAKALPEAARAALVEAVEAAAGGGARPAWDGVMGWAELRALVAAGHEVGSHTLTHPLLPGLDEARLAREVAGSRARLEHALGVPCRAFCYPNGDCDARVVEAVRRAGYRVAVVTAWGPNRPGADPLRLTRCELQGPTSRDAGGRLSEARLALRLSPWFAWRRP